MCVYMCICICICIYIYIFTFLAARATALEHCNTPLQDTTTHCNTPSQGHGAYTATHQCNTLNYISPHFTTLKHTRSRARSLSLSPRHELPRANMTIHCNTLLQHTAAHCCNILQHTTATHGNTPDRGHGSYRCFARTWQPTATHPCNTL